MSGLAVIGGGEAYRLLREGTLQGEELGAQTTPFGTSEPVFRIGSDGNDYLFLSRHGTDAYRINPTAVNYRANIYALKDLGAQYVLSWSACGSIAEGFPTGSFAILEDVVDETRHRPHTFFEQSGLGFLRQYPLFCPVLRDVLSDAMGAESIDVRFGGVYVCTEGPRLDTAAEIRKYQSFGAELIGTTLAPEVFLARELELCYASFALVMNRAEGTVRRDYVAGELFEGMVEPKELEVVNQALARFPDIIEEVANRINDQSPENLGDCPCPHLLDAYRKAGVIGDDWHDYVTPPEDPA
jgi:5'-methylthioadenosine phosphorylase